MKHSKPKTYEADFRGKKVRVTVPGRHQTVAYSDEAWQVLRDNLSPQAVAAVVSCLRTNATNNSDVDRQVHWFAEELTKLVGGHEGHARLMKELGL